ncbi:DUF982 domain-containing protein [Rhizobium deserti]|uniref:DUF982 domain-containing protein n=1 Tax=Rhizobium deserti TaxID=2547961 RepID=A0A4R5UFM9_9HYPH|nr:DUF982 domain-containing protein [Rhizobium deserti]TDK34303.1 DUF982 domain-containing protein [Rhizobium deserti]
MKHETIEASLDTRWLAPIWVRVGFGMPEAIRGPREALECLTYRWPAQRGQHYQAAKRSCTAALTKQLLCDQARDAFMRASIEAQMLD